MVLVRDSWRKGLASELNSQMSTTRQLHGAANVLADQCDSHSPMLPRVWYYAPPEISERLQASSPYLRGSTSIVSSTEPEVNSSQETLQETLTSEFLLLDDGSCINDQVEFNRED
jgi:hypothetical protein